jgi:formyl-CoA transferase
MSDLPLSDLVVLDLTIARAGPTAVRQLADWGADVIRVERPAKGDDAGVSSARHGSDFQNLHRNKRSVTLDLQTDAGRAALLRMAERADVLVENMRPQVKHRLGIDPDTVLAVNPRLVYASISGFGQDGPYGQRGGVDQIAQGLGGLMSITGSAETAPLRVGVPIADLSAGVYLALGIMVALHERERTGRGRWVHTSLLESMVAMLDFQAARYTMEGEVPPPAGNDHPTMIPMGTFRTADGHVNIAAPAGRLWRSFCEAVGLTDLLTDARFATSPDRSARRHELNEIIGARLAERPTAEWVDLLNEVGVPAGPVNSIDQTFADPQVRHLGLVSTVEHPQLGPVGLVRNAVNLVGVDNSVRTPTPELGEHQAQVLKEFGFSDDEIAELS